MELTFYCEDNRCVISNVQSLALGLTVALGQILCGPGLLFKENCLPVKETIHNFSFFQFSELTV